MREDRLLAVASAAAALAFGALALAFGQDVNWDQRNYHIYNPHAWLRGRLGFDLAPAGRPTFYNPFLHLPFWWLIEALPAKGATFVLGAVQGGGAFALLAWTARRAGAHPALALAAAAVGCWGGGALGLLGTSFFDNTLGLLALGALLIAVARYRRLVAGEMLPAMFAGFLVGLATGLKLTMAIYALGLGAALLALPLDWRGRLRLVLVFGLGGFVGVALGGGPWMWTLWSEFGNPIFPHFNQVFASPWAPTRSGHDPQFLPQGLIETLFYPFVFAEDGSRVGEAPFRDVRLALLWIAALGALLWRRESRLLDRGRGLFVLVATVATYVAWQTVFGIYRYAVAIEQIAPLALLAAIDRLPLGWNARRMTAALAFVAIVALARPADWGRAPWTDEAARDWIGLVPPKLDDPDRTLVVMTGYQPMSYVVPRFPPGARFIRLTSSFTNPGEAHRINERITRAIADHEGEFRWLVHDHEAEDSMPALAHYSLAPDRASCVGLPNRLDRTLLFCRLSRAGG